MKCGLGEETVKKIKGVFTSFSEIQEVVLYGSRAMGTEKHGSDIDLALKGGGITLSILNQVRSRLDDLMLPYSFDLAIYDQIDNPDLIDHIKRVGKAFFVR